MALNFGHGEFPRTVAAPGDPKEAQEITNEAFYLSQKFKIPSIILGDKHLAESYYTLEEESSIKKVENTTQLIRYNSYEKDNIGSATENAQIIKANVDRRLRKTQEIKKEVEKFPRFSVYGETDSMNVVVSWGSTKGAILDAIKDLDVEFLHIKYLEPFSDGIKENLLRKNIILVENSSTGQLAGVISKHTGMFIQDKNKILRYDGRPFLADELRKEIEKRLI